MSNWWVVYSDRSLYTGDPWLAPALGVQAVVVRDPDHGWTLETRGDFYIYLSEQDTWRAVDLYGKLDYEIAPGPSRALWGRTMFDADYHALLRWLNEHPDLPPKSGWRPGEPRA